MSALWAKRTYIAMKSYNAGRLIAEKLKLSYTTGSHVVLCPFHTNTNTPSFSVDLDKGVWFCHSACDDPKGGGVVEFLVKWSKIVDQKPLTKQDVRRQLHRTFSIPNAKALLREAAEENLRLFAFYMPHLLGDILREFDREIDLINEMWGAWPVSNARKWSRIEEIHKLRHIYEWGFDTCRAASKHATDELAAAYSFFTSMGAWDTFTAQMARETQRQRHAHNRKRATRRPVRTPVLPEKGDLCRVIPSPMKRPKRQPVLSSMSTMTLPKRHPVQ
jgi:hypothetical protein